MEAKEIMTSLKNPIGENLPTDFQSKRYRTDSPGKSLNIIPIIWLERQALRAWLDTEGNDRRKGFEEPVIGFDITTPQRLDIASQYGLGVIIPSGSLSWLFALYSFRLHMGYTGCACQKLHPARILKIMIVFSWAIQKPKSGKNPPAGNKKGGFPVTGHGITEVL